MTVSPASIPAAAAMNSRLARRGAYGMNSASQPTMSPLGTHRAR